MYNEKITYGVISTLNDDLGMLIPSALYQNRTEINIMSGNVVISSFPQFT
jgi:hypothetical protein